MIAETLQIRQQGKSFHVVPDANREFWEKVSRGDWEAETYAILERFIGRGKSYIDIGSWIGPTLLYGCQLAGRAYGIEPDPIAYAELARNVASNKPFTDNISLFNMCISPQSGKVPLGNRSEGGDSTSSLLFGHAEVNWTVDGLRFDDFIQQNGIDDCSFIKMDIEGGEYSVLPTMRAYLKKHRPTLYLSLHPHCLGGLQRGGLGARLYRAAAAYIKTLSIIRCLRFYRHLYDRRGNELTPLKLLRGCRRSAFLSVVATDLEWHADGSEGVQ